MVLDALIKIKNEVDHDAHVPPLLPRGDLRLVRDEHRRHQHAGLHQGHGRHPRDVKIYPLPHMPVIKDLIRTSPISTRSMRRETLAADAHSAPPTASGLQSKEDQEKIDGPRPASCAACCSTSCRVLLVEQRPLPGAGGVAGRVPLDHRHARRGHRRAARRARGSVPPVPLPHES